MLVLSNARLFLENLLKYGILVDANTSGFSIHKGPYNMPAACLVIVSNVFIVAALYTERRLSVGCFSERVGLLVHSINLSVTLCFPVAIVLMVKSMTPGTAVCVLISLQM
ncbi:diacylglycerol O-acyltransferase 1-like [Salvelinus sp. IW2-2015]|uniref:diacylglycerol O-acyltransferase 1-like n=1 Tax=Salvelinus sp. IW2-2015 TaxID=2691554 RepID=UPI000CEB31EB|nr:diacylglycerol O-acyltransferase 1-like [Salvelinus alpinus]